MAECGQTLDQCLERRDIDGSSGDSSVCLPYSSFNPFFFFCIMGILQWLREYTVCLQCRRPRFEVRKIPWRREWLPTPVFLPGEFHGQRSLVGCSPWSHKESHTTEQVTLSLFSLYHIFIVPPVSHLFTHTSCFSSRNSY